MTYVRRYSYRNHCYEKPEELPKKWHTPLISDSMDEIINCACCGKELKFGDSFTSMIICDMSGAFGYPVCEVCYEKEWKERRDAQLFENTEDLKRRKDHEELREDHGRNDSRGTGGTVNR